MKTSTAFNRMLRLCVALGLPASVAWQTARAADGPKFLFTSQRTGNQEIFLANADGTEAKNLTNNPADDHGGSWSPDGKHIVFASDRTGAGDLYVMDADGGNVRQLTSDPAKERAAAWSPDGKRIAFVRHVTETNPEVFLINADASGETNLTSSEAYDSDPCWFPDGKKLLFARGADGFKLYTLEPGAGEPQLIPGLDGLAGWVFPGCSPDGKRIAYTGTTGADLEIYAADANGDNRKQLTSLKGRNTFATWSLDGKQIAFQHHEGAEGNGALYVMDAATGDNMTLICPLEGPLHDGRPAWKPR